MTIALVLGIPLAGLLAWYIWYRIEYKARGWRHNERLYDGCIYHEGERDYQKVTEALIAAGKARTTTNPSTVEVEMPGGRFPLFTTKATVPVPIHLSDDRTIADVLFRGNSIQTEHARAFAETLCRLGDRNYARPLIASKRLHELDGQLKALAEELRKHLPPAPLPEESDLDLDIEEDVETGGSD